jgi:hypothetical protein
VPVSSQNFDTYHLFQDIVAYGNNCFYCRVKGEEANERRKVVERWATEVPTAILQG